MRKAGSFASGLSLATLSLMFTQETPLEIVLFNENRFDLRELAERLTAFKASASRMPTPVTEAQLRDISNSPTNILLIQIAKDEETELVVGMVHISVVHLEDRAQIGPIAIDKDSTPRGHGTPLMEAAIEYIKAHFPDLRRIDLTNRPSHDLEVWYGKFGFKGRTEENGDPSTVYRLTLV